MRTVDPQSVNKIRLEGCPPLIHEPNGSQHLILIPNFVLIPGGQSVDIDRATASLQAAHRLEWLRCVVGSVAQVWVDEEISDVATCIIAIDEIEEI